VSSDPVPLAEIIERLDLLASAPKYQVLTAAELLGINFADRPDVIGDSILPEGGGLILAGESGVGKSLLALEWAVRLAKARPVLGLPVSRSWRVHYQGQENTLRSMQHRLRRMLRGLDLKDAGTLTFGDPTMSFDLGLKGDQERLHACLATVKSEVVILDPLSSFLGAADENNNLAVRSRLDVLTGISRKLGCAFIVVDHFGKPTESQDGAHRTRGASSKKDWCDTLIGLTVKPHESKVLRLVTFHKVRHGPDGVQRPTVLVERDAYFLHWPVREDELLPAEKVAEILIDLGGRAESKTAFSAELAKQVPCSKATAWRSLTRALERGLVAFGEEGARGARSVVVTHGSSRPPLHVTPSPHPFKED